MSRMRGPGGLEIVAIVLDGHDQYRIDQWVGKNKYWIADCYDIAEVER